MKSIIKQLLLNLLIVFSIGSCSCSTKESKKEWTSEAADGYLLRVKKIDSYTSHKGILTGIDYGTSHSYRYSFKLSPGRIYWEGDGTMPKELIICRDELYVNYYRETYQLQSDKQIYSVQSQYAKHVDKRYFFKLLGEQYWVDAMEEDHKKAKDCKKLAIPNEGEFKMIS